MLNDRHFFVLDVKPVSPQKCTREADINIGFRLCWEGSSFASPSPRGHCLSVSLTLSFVSAF